MVIYGSISTSTSITAKLSVALNIKHILVENISVGYNQLCVISDDSFDEVIIKEKKFQEIVLDNTKDHVVIN